jgi:hypothetical protein
MKPRQQKQYNFIDGNLNVQRYHDEILRPIVVPFILHHHLVFKLYNALHPCHMGLGVV